MSLRAGARSLFHRLHPLPPPSITPSFNSNSVSLWLYPPLYILIFSPASSCSHQLPPPSIFSSSPHSSCSPIPPSAPPILSVHSLIYFWVCIAVLSSLHHAALNLPVFCLFLSSVFILIPHWFHLPVGLETGLHFYLHAPFIPHTTPPLQHAPSWLLLYSSQQWVSDLNLSLCITGPPVCSWGTPWKPNSMAATLSRVSSFMRE